MREGRGLRGTQPTESHRHYPGGERAVQAPPQPSPLEVASSQGRRDRQTRTGARRALERLVAMPTVLSPAARCAQGLVLSLEPSSPLLSSPLLPALFPPPFLFFFFFFLIFFSPTLFIYLFIFGCVGSSVRARAFSG